MYVHMRVYIYMYMYMQTRSFTQTHTHILTRASPQKTGYARGAANTLCPDQPTTYIHTYTYTCTYTRASPQKTGYARGAANTLCQEQPKKQVSERYFKGRFCSRHADFCTCTANYAPGTTSTCVSAWNLCGSCCFSWR